MFYILDLTPGNGKRPCKIIVKQEVKQEYSPPSHTPNVAQMSLTPYNETLDTLGVSHLFHVANHEALLRILQNAADVHCVMAADATDEQSRQRLQCFREKFLREKEVIELQIQQQQQEQEHQQHFQQQVNYMQ